MDGKGGKSAQVQHGKAEPERRPDTTQLPPPFSPSPVRRAKALNRYSLSLSLSTRVCVCVCITSPSPNDEEPTVWEGASRGSSRLSFAPTPEKVLCSLFFFLLLPSEHDKQKKKEFLSLKKKQPKIPSIFRLKKKVSPVIWTCKEWRVVQ